MKFLLAFILVSLLSETDAAVVTISPDTYENICHLISRFVTKTFVNTRATLHYILASDNKDSDAVFLMSRVIKWTKGMLKAQIDNLDIVSSLSHTYPRTSNLFIIDSYKAFHRIRNFLIAENFRVMGYYIIILRAHNDEERSLENIQKIFQDCFDFFLTNVNLILENPVNNDIFVYTFYPYSPEHCAKVLPTLIEYLPNGETQDPLISGIFPPKLDNFYECRLKVGSWSFPPHMFFEHRENNDDFVEGIDGNIIKWIANMLNFKIDIIEPHSSNWKRGNILSNGTATSGVFKMIQDKEIDLTIAAHGYSYIRAQVMAASIDYWTTEMLFIVPATIPYSSFERLFFPFSMTVWNLILLTFLLGLIVVKIIQKHFKKYEEELINVDSNLYSPFLNMFNAFLGGFVQPEPNRLFPRLLFAHWMLLSLVVRSIFQGALYDFMRKKLSRRMNYSINELIDKGYHLYITGSDIRYLDSLPQAQGRVTKVDGSMDSYFKRLYDPDFKGVVVHTLIQLQRFNQRFSINGLLRALPERLMFYPYTIYYQKNSYLQQPIDRCLRKLSVHGFLQYAYTNRTYNFRQENANLATSLRVADLQGCFQVYFALIFASTLIFAVEVGTMKIPPLVLIAIGLSLQSAISNVNIRVPKYSERLPITIASIIEAWFEKPRSGLHFTLASLHRKRSKENEFLINDVLRLSNSVARVTINNIDLTGGRMLQMRPRTSNAFIVDSYPAFRVIYQHLLEENFNICHGNYLIVLFGQKPDLIIETIGKIFRDLFEKFVVNVNLVYQNLTTNEIIVYTYFPYRPSHCGKVVPVVYKRLHTEIFPNKFTNFYGCPLVVATYLYAPHMSYTRDQNGKLILNGADGFVLHMLAEQMNFTVEIVQPKTLDKRGSILANGTALGGTFEMIQKKTANLTICGHGFSNRRARVMTASCQYAATEFVFVLPIQYPYTSIEKLFFPFSKSVWIYLGITIVIGCMLMQFLKIFLHHFGSQLAEYESRHKPTFFNMLRACLGENIRIEPKLFFSRIVFIIWLISSIILRSAFQGAVFDFLRRKSSPTNYLTVDKICHGGYDIYIETSSFQFLESLTHCKARFLTQNGLALQYFKRLQKPGFKGIVIQTKVQLLLFNSIFYRNGILKTLPERVSFFPYVIYYPQNSYLKQAFDDSLANYNDYGFIKYAQNRYLPAFLEDTTVSEVLMKLSLSDMEGSFQVYLFLIGVSTIVFILELLSKRYTVIRKFFEKIN